MQGKTFFLSESDFALLLDILKPIPYKIYVYGSRSRGNPKKFSDIDLYIDGLIPDDVLWSLRDECDQSNLPIKVDILTPRHCSDHFLSLIQQDMKLIQDR